MNIKVMDLMSSFDLLKLVENHRFVMKDAPAASSRGGARREREEAS